ncbi:MAG: type II toxin-antitoxin system HipA family toxin [Clostridiales Family XIII bacterium]|jgi:serine/threonine-protein kinase HipA|nr:type II toxin-antitoxin system HipA family toxin [Clostridiales Family XIII bacterium]
MIDVPKLSSISISLFGRTVGQLALTPDNLCAFQYDSEFVRGGFSISPLKLPLGEQLFVAGRHPFGGGFGIFDDSLPDGWGKLVQDRFLRAGGIEPDRLSILQRLAVVGTHGRGALEYMPNFELMDMPCDSGAASGIDALSAQAAEMLETSGAAGEDYSEMYRFGGSSGGARPKVFYIDGDGEWLVKFRSSDDPKNMGTIEYETSLLAKECGIDMPETKLFGEGHFGVRRFDRTKSGKVHVASAAGLLHADYRAPSLDYSGLLALCRIITRNMKDVEQLFLRMVFNIVIENRDDHAKNFAFLMDKRGEWRLAPAYDIVPSYGFGGYHTTVVNGSGKPTYADMLAVAASAGLSAKKAREIISRVEETCA